jgi:hypothetical protein
MGKATGEIFGERQERVQDAIALKEFFSSMPDPRSCNLRTDCVPGRENEV